MAEQLRNRLAALKELSSDEPELDLARRVILNKFPEATLGITISGLLADPRTRSRVLEKLEDVLTQSSDSGKAEDSKVTPKVSTVEVLDGSDSMMGMIDFLELNIDSDLEKGFQLPHRKM